MADFMQAVKWMKEGKKVRRSFWDKNVFLQPNGRNGEITNNDGKTGQFSYCYFEATDWEIYEEEDGWKLQYTTVSDILIYSKLGNLFDSHTYLDSRELKRLKETILEDCNDGGYYFKIKEILDKRFGF
jgi:hypothetical protein